VNFAIAATPPMPIVGPVGASAKSAGAGSAEHRKLTDAAQQFEGMLLQEMLKPMKEHGFCQEEGESDDKDEGSGFGDTLSSFGAESVATAIAKAGGLGIAKQVVQQVEREGSKHDGTSVGTKTGLLVPK
jgi:Rod binding domain-containing protein